MYNMFEILTTSLVLNNWALIIKVFVGNVLLDLKYM